jgi:hypothetical protein
MQEKIEQPQVRYSIPFVIFVFTLVCVTGLLSYISVKTGFDSESSLLFTPAYSIAAQISADYGIKEFNDLPLPEISIIENLGMFGWIFTQFVVLPVGIISFWNNRKQNHSSVSLYFLAVCISMSLFMSVIDVAAAVQSPGIFSKMKQDNAISENRDNIIMDLVVIATKAQQHYIVPRELGGGGMSFKSTSDPKSVITISGIGLKEKTKNGIYKIENLRKDTVLVLTGKGKVRLSNNTFAFYEVEITPETYSIHKLDNGR